MAEAAEVMEERMEENAQALSLLAEVVDKLQGLIVASKNPDTPKLLYCPASSKTPDTPKLPPYPVTTKTPESPKTAYRPPTPYPPPPPSRSHHSSSSSSNTSLGGYLDGPRSPARKVATAPNQNGRCERRETSATLRSGNGCYGNNGNHLSNGNAARPGEDRNDHNDTTGCLSSQKKIKKKKKK